MTKLVESKNVTVLNGLERKIHTGKYCSSKMLFFQHTFS